MSAVILRVTPEGAKDQYFFAGLVEVVVGGLIVLLVTPEPVVLGLAMQDCPLFLALSQDAIVW